MKALVTGASGFIGSHIALALNEKGYQVRCMTRNKRDPLHLSDKGIEIVEGDLLNEESLKNALKDQDYLFHAAAYYSFWVPNPKQMYDINVEGTRKIFELAGENNIKKIIYTSTVGTIGLPGDGTPGNENTPYHPHHLKGHYKISKYQAEQVALDMSGKGIPIVIVNPSAPMGPGDIKPTPTGQIIVDFLNRKMPAYTDTGLNVVDVRDVAIGHVLAAHHGMVGQKYILGNQNMSLKEILDLLSEITGLSSPSIKIPNFVLPPIATISSFFGKLLNFEPRVTPDAVKMAQRYMYFDPTKAIQELGMTQRPVRDTLTDAVKWFRENNYIKNPKHEI